MFCICCAFKYHKHQKRARLGVVVNPVMIPATTIVQTQPDGTRQPVYIVTNNPQQVQTQAGGAQQPVYIVPSNPQQIGNQAPVQLPANATQVVMTTNPPTYTASTEPTNTENTKANLA